MQAPIAAASAAQSADLSVCENEPIQIPGAVQPHGALFAVDEQSGRILSVSANAAAFVGREPATLLNARIDTLLGPGGLSRLREVVATASALTESYPERIAVNGNNEEFDVFVHARDGILIVELERAQAQTAAELEAFFGHVRSTIALIQNADSMESLASVVVEQTARISGFDRVMLYRFDRDWNGEVIAEHRKAGMAAYVGLHYPASDIPRQARELYRRNVLRIIPDAAYDPVPLIPQTNPLTGKPFDLSMATTRSVSPVHLEYLANMGVRATLTVSLLKHGQLWGLIAAHHDTPLAAAYRVRVACELIGRTAALRITTIEDAAEDQYRLRLRRLHPVLVDAVNRAGEVSDAIATDALLEIAGAHGAAVKSEGEPRVIGRTPRGRDIRQIVAWLEERDTSDGDAPFATDCLPLENPEFAHLKDRACGLLAVPLTSTEGGWILWFRPEVVRTVSWGGNPNKPVEDAGERISPRKSFEAWKQQVQMHSLPWQDVEIEAAIELRRLLSDVMMRRAREYARLNAKLARSNEELESFAYVASHDLKEPLRGIFHYTQFLESDFGEQLGPRGREMIAGMAKLAERMEGQIESLLTLARVGHDEPAGQRCDANAALDEALKLLSNRLDGVAIAQSDLPYVRIAPARLREVFLNLIGNAIKYNERPHKKITIGVTERERPASQPARESVEPPSGKMATFFVADNGIGIKEKHLETVFRMFKRLHVRDAYGGGTGAGLPIARKIVEQQGGTMWVESVPDEGSTFYFTLPLEEA